MSVYKSHAIKLYPTKSQEIFFRKSCGVARFSYNWALLKWKELYEFGENPSAYALIKLQNSIKKEQFPWMKDVGKCAPQYAIHNLERGYKMFFKKIAMNKPKLKKKGFKDSFVSHETPKNFKQKDFNLWVPRLGWVKCAENLRFNGPIYNVTIKRTANLWFAVVSLKTNDTPKEIPVVSENQTIIGVDLGIKSMAVTSDGEVFENARALQKRMKSLKRKQRSFDRKSKGSNNKKKQLIRLARLHYKIGCIRKNSIHNATSAIVNRADVVVLEDLAVSKLLQNYKLSQALGDVSPYEFRRQIEYKAVWQGKQVIIADRYFPSSQICSCCGHRKTDQKLSDRVYKCISCGSEMDRDLNAAKNLANYGSTVKYTGSQAFGEGSSSVAILDSPSMNEELSIVINTFKP